LIVLAGLLVFIPLSKDDLVNFKNKYKNQLVNLIIKRGCYSIATYFGILSTSIIMTLSESAGLPLNRDLTTIMFIIGLAGYLMLLFLVFGTVVQIIKIMQNEKLELRVGND
jgi:hypothetical protein